MLYTHGHTNIGWTVKIYIYQLCVDTVCHLEDLPNVKVNRDGESKESILSTYLDDDDDDDDDDKQNKKFFFCFFFNCGLHFNFFTLNLK